MALDGSGIQAALQPAVEGGALDRIIAAAEAEAEPTGIDPLLASLCLLIDAWALACARLTVTGVDQGDPTPLMSGAPLLREMHGIMSQAFVAALADELRRGGP